MGRTPRTAKRAQRSARHDLRPVGAPPPARGGREPSCSGRADIAGGRDGRAVHVRCNSSPGTGEKVATFRVISRQARPTCATDATTDPGVLSGGRAARPANRAGRERACGRGRPRARAAHHGAQARADARRSSISASASVAVLVRCAARSAQRRGGDPLVRGVRRAVAPRGGAGREVPRGGIGRAERGAVDRRRLPQDGRLGRRGRAERGLELVAAHPGGGAAARGARGDPARRDRARQRA